MNIAHLINEIKTKAGLSQTELANILGTSLVSVNKWEHSSASPSPAQIQHLKELHHAVISHKPVELEVQTKNRAFASRGLSRSSYKNTLFDSLMPTIELNDNPNLAILERLMHDGLFAENGNQLLSELLLKYQEPARVANEMPKLGMSAGKNTYTYDAHTYHTKVPPQGIAELIAHYLPEGGLVLDPFAGSGMTGVACNTIGHDCVLNELSPAACFISDRFTSHIDPELFEAGVQAILASLSHLRKNLYTTQCRECHNPTEILYTVWSYNVICKYCGCEFLLWDHCRRYGNGVREHKILNEFPCPECGTIVKKSYLRRTTSEPVMVVYRCCQKEYKRHPLNADDLLRIQKIEQNPPLAEGFFPANELPDGVNLRQPKKHGLDRVDKFYTPRNLAAMSQLWKTIHLVESKELAAFLAFAFTSLYQRVTRLSEFRFWGGSGNMARFNVPFIFKEANVFDTFLRKARAIQDHLQATASSYHGHSLVVRNPATNLYYLPDNSVDLIFTDPPFGANINYSDMNFLWESWLGVFTDTTEEAIVNRLQGKGIEEYCELMTTSLAECYRVLRVGHWLLLVFMNSSQEVWEALRSAIIRAGFVIQRVDIFDKQHATFKQLVSDNTAGADLVLHCYKPENRDTVTQVSTISNHVTEIYAFLESVDSDKYINEFLHVNRESEFDYRRLYSEWMSQAITNNAHFISFADFRGIAREWLDRN